MSMMKNKQWILHFVLIVITILSAGTTSADIKSTLKVDDLNTKIEKIMLEHVEKREKSSGLAVAIYKNGNISLFRKGLRDLKNKLPVEVDTLFEIGSISKVFTGAMLASQIQDGKIDINDSIQSHLPEGVNSPLFKGNKDKPISFKHLTTHKSGLPRLPSNMGLLALSSADPYAKYSTEKLYNFLNKHKLNSEPGTTAEYSNLGAGLLGQLMVNTSKKSYSELLEELITKLLKLKDTTVTLTQEQKKRFSQGYSVFGASSTAWSFQDSLVGAGGIRSSIQDMATFLQVNIEAQDSSTTNVKNKQHEIQSILHLGQQKQDEYDDYNDIAMGWLITKNGMHWHNGGTGGFRTFIGFNKDKKIGVVVLANSIEEVDSVGFKIHNLLKD